MIASSCEIESKLFKDLKLKELFSFGSMCGVQDLWRKTTTSTATHYHTGRADEVRDFETVYIED